MIRISGTELDAATAAFLQTNGIRAVCLFRQNMRDATQLSRLTADLRAVMGPGALIAIDQEGGAVVRTTWGPAAPSAMALGAADDLTLAHAVGAAVARSLRALGFNWNFAPVLDVNNNPNNPVIAERAFGGQPGRAAELAMAWMAGSLSQGVACCVKHFPGHGDTHVDSHRDLPIVDKPRAALESLELAPFRAAAASAPAMMTAHIVYPALDPDYPATLSRTILHGLLRQQWGFRGVIITDGMDMHAIAMRHGTGAAAVRALAAGADMVMALGTPATQAETLDALAAAIESGTLSGDEVTARLLRLDTLALRYPCAPQPYHTHDDDLALMACAWRRGLTAHGKPRRPAPGARVLLVMCGESTGDGVSESGVPAPVLAAALGRLFDVKTVIWDDAELFDWRAMETQGRFVILASTTRRRYGSNARATWRPDLHLALWNPYQALDIAAPALVSYGFATPALDAVCAWLAGDLDANGTWPL